MIELKKQRILNEIIVKNLTKNLIIQLQSAINFQIENSTLGLLGPNGCENDINRYDASLITPTVDKFLLMN